MTKEADNKKYIPVDVDQIDLDRLKLATSENPGTLTFGSNRGGVAFTPNKEGAIKSRAYSAMTQQLDMQLANIVEQMKVLAKQVEELKERKRVSELIYTAAINFEPLTGRIYFLYEVTKDEEVIPRLSLLSPKDWGEEKMKKQKFLAEVMLLADHTWKVLSSDNKFLQALK
tara:strand:- start:15865 stop:16377 length:513 start_codon:yes stop_codon:yes gene_type:complete